jgi:hypothetical protein
MECCDHGDEIMCHKVFLDRFTIAHLARKKLREVLSEGRHWTFAVTPDCAASLYALADLHRRLADAPMEVLPLPDVKHQPVLCTLPKARVDWDDVEATLGHAVIGRAEAEAKHWLLLSTQSIDEGLEAISRWIAHDALMN